MINEEVTEVTLKLLNEMLLLDYQLTYDLVENRVKCNSAIFEHPTIQVVDNKVGLLGVLNGLCGSIDRGPKQGWGPITSVYDDTDGRLQRFERTKE